MRFTAVKNITPAVKYAKAVMNYGDMLPDLLIDVLLWRLKAFVQIARDHAIQKKCLKE
ncbi:hypothetical protein VZL98_02035 [Peptoniphilaceae bacterium AMB_02]|nr:hypothetical protein VZL98_02035 [Peptoniphilaceae bacterium AMB_02]